MAKYFKIAEIDAATFERMTGDKLDCLQVVTLVDDGNVYVAVDEDRKDYIDFDLEIFDAGEGHDNAPTAGPFAIEDEANKCVVGGYHKWQGIAVSHDEVGNRVDTYQCRKCGETFKVKFEAP